MSVTLQDAIPVAGTGWLFRWSSGLSNPLYRIYVNGTLVTETRVNRLTLRLATDDVVEVRDDALTPESATAGTVLLSWAAVSGAVHYRVERLIAAVWTEEARVYDKGLPRLTHRATSITAAADVELRVVAVDAAGNESTAAARTVTVKRHPPAPLVALTYDDGTGKVTVAAA